MKPILMTFLLILPASFVSARTESADRTGDQQLVARAKSTINPSVSVCVESGDVYIKGWDRNEVLVTGTGDQKVEVVRPLGSATDLPANELEVRRAGNNSVGKSATCLRNGNVTLSVPFASNVSVKTLDGDVDADHIAEIHAVSSSGSLSVRGISKSSTLKTASGDITIENSGGRVEVATLSGQVTAQSLTSRDVLDTLSVTATSGDVMLSEIAQPAVTVRVISGDVTIEGQLARSGRYDLNTTNGDITLVLPRDSSFGVNARVFKGGEIVTDFPLRYTGATPVASHPIVGGLISGTYGSGNARLTLGSLNGTIRIRKKDQGHD
jgi:DUF4097 and DUF4098 domain-containing protein YvlB